MCFKDELVFENYLSLTVPKLRFAISRFRCSSHNLTIELGRHTKPNKTELAKRVCKACHVVEDEIHHLTACVVNSKQRELLYREAQKYEPKFLKYSDVNKFKFILQTKEVKLLQAFGMFLYKSYPDRSKWFSFFFHHAVKYFVKYVYTLLHSKNFMHRICYYVICIFMWMLYIYIYNALCL